MRFLVPDAERIGRAEIGTYAARCEAAVCELARACGLDEGLELARFRASRDRFAAAAPQEASGAGNVIADLSAALPLFYELVATLEEGRVAGLAYLTQGRAGATLPDGLAAALRGALHLLVESRGPKAQALLLADVFRLAFPDLGALAELSPLAQGIIVGVAPTAAGPALKVYLNTRLQPGAPNRERVLAILARVGHEDAGSVAAAYDALYGPGLPTHFRGVGIDLHPGDGPARAKLYVHAPRAQLDTVLARLVELGAAAGAALRSSAEELLAALDSEALAQEVELALALRPGHAPTLKLTAFFVGEAVGVQDWTRLQRLLARWQLPTEPVTRVLAALTGEARAAAIQRHPLHAVGIEVPRAAHPKVNVYVQPVL